MDKITSFTINHLKLLPGIYVSRKDTAGGHTVTTFDLRMTRPNYEPVINTAEIHTIEHLGATFLRNHRDYGSRVLYFGPMGCQTGFYLLVRSAEHDLVYQVVLDVLKQIIEHKGAVFGASRKECGHSENLNLENAIKECKTYKKVLEARPAHYQYPGEK